MLKLSFILSNLMLTSINSTEAHSRQRGREEKSNKSTNYSISFLLKSVILIRESKKFKEHGASAMRSRMRFSFILGDLQIWLSD